MTYAQSRPPPHILICIFTQPPLLSFVTASAFGVPPPPPCADIICTCPKAQISLAFGCCCCVMARGNWDAKAEQRMQPGAHKSCRSIASELGLTFALFSDQNYPITVTRPCGRLKLSPQGEFQCSKSFHYKLHRLEPCT